MQIPYGIIMVISGLVLGIKGPLAAGVLLSLTGMGVLMCARASLKAWKAGRASTPFTLISAMATAYLTWIFGAPLHSHVSAMRCRNDRVYEYNPTDHTQQ